MHGKHARSGAVAARFGVRERCLLWAVVGTAAAFMVPAFARTVAVGGEARALHALEAAHAAAERYYLSRHEVRVPVSAPDDPDEDGPAEGLGLKQPAETEFGWRRYCLFSGPASSLKDAASAQSAASQEPAAEVTVASSRAECLVFDPSGGLDLTPEPSVRFIVASDAVTGGLTTFYEWRARPTREGLTLEPPLRVTKRRTAPSHTKETAGAEPR